MLLLQDDISGSQGEQKMARGVGEQLQTKTVSTGHPSGMPKRQNSYVRLLGFLLMAVRGLGVLMLTWITAVLLGGSISNLGTVDFWPLTVIAILQMIGVFSLFHQLKYGDIGYFHRHLFHLCLPCCGWCTGRGCGRGCDSIDSLIDKILDWIPNRKCCYASFQVIVVLVVVVAMIIYFLIFSGIILPGAILVVCLCLAVVNVVKYGPVVIAAIWWMVRVLIFRRLFFTSASDGPGMFGSRNDASRVPNLTSAVDGAYWLGVAQGAVHLYWYFCYHGRKRIVKDVTSRLGLESESETVRCYWQETAAGCEKEPAFVRGRNLMTYAVELLESKSPDKFLAGIRILGTVIRQGLLPDEELPKELSREELLGKLVLIKQLLTGSASFGHLIEELQQMLDLRSPYGREIRGHAARIVLLVAQEIHLEEHPRCVECVSYLLDPIESNKRNPPYAYQRAWQLRDTPYERDWCLQWYERGWLVETSWQESPESGNEGEDTEWDQQVEGYMDMVWLGLSIFEKLAADQHNCSVMISTVSLLPRIMAPLCSNLLHLHSVDNQPWGRIVAASLAVMYRLAQAPGEDGITLLRSKISPNEHAIRTILERILQCQTCPAALETAMELLTLVCMDASPGFIKILFNTFTDVNCKENIRTLAGRKLVLLSPQKADIIMRLDGILVSLKDIFLRHPGTTLGIIAVEIMDHLCEGNYSMDGECHRNMKNAMTAVMPQVLAELFHCDGSAEEATPTATGTEEAISIGPEDEEIRITLQRNNQNAGSPSHQQNREAEQKDIIEWQRALLSLSTKLFDKYASNDDQNLPSLLDEVAPKLTKMADANMQPTADSLRIMKLITKLVISVLKHGYAAEGMDSLMTSLISGSNKMMNLDGLMLCSGVYGGADKTVSTLYSLVDEAQQEYTRVRVVQDSSSGNN